MLCVYSKSSFPGSYFSYSKHNQRSQTGLSPTFNSSKEFGFCSCLCSFLPCSSKEPVLIAIQQHSWHHNSPDAKLEFSSSHPACYSSNICACGCLLAGLLSRLLWLCGYLKCCFWWQLLHWCRTSHLVTDLSCWTLFSSSCQEFTVGLEIIWYVNTFFIISNLLLPWAMQWSHHNFHTQVHPQPPLYEDGWIWTLKPNELFNSFRPTITTF